MEKYFKNLDLMYTFFLLELDGSLRMEKLNIQPYLFSSKKAATEWRDNILQHLTNKKAINKLNELYGCMVESCDM